MKIQPLTPAAKHQRDQIAREARRLADDGHCPTCWDFEHGGVYPHAHDRRFYDTDLLTCLLDAYPRSLGHTIVLIKPHFEDLSRLPEHLHACVYQIIHITIQALKDVTGAPKIYLCTMCDGPRNHLHYQLIPRLTDDDVTGSRVFVRQRGLLTDHAPAIESLSRCMNQLLPIHHSRSPS